VTENDPGGTNWEMAIGCRLYIYMKQRPETECGDNEMGDG